MKPENSRPDSRTADSLSLPSWLRPDGDGVLVSVHLQPGARRTALVGPHGGRLKIAVQAPPIEGRANEALVSWLAGHLGLPRQQVRLTSGHQGREKTLRIDGIDVGRARRLLAPD